MARVRSNTEIQPKLPLDSPLRGDIHGDRSILDFPFFALEKKPQGGTIEHNLGDITITIRAGEGGIATMYDKAIILYVGTIHLARKNRGDPATQEVAFAANDFFRAVGVPNPGKKDYERFNESMSRLQGTQIQTNLKTGGTTHRGWFSWIENARAVYSDAPEGYERLQAVHIRLCDFLFRAIERDASMLNYHHEYFKLGLIERRLYEIARCHYEGKPFELNLAELHRKVGSKSAMRRFKQHIIDIEQGDSLPHYTISVRDQVEGGRLRARPDETIITFSERPRGPVSHLNQLVLTSIENHDLQAMPAAALAAGTQGQLLIG